MNLLTKMQHFLRVLIKLVLFGKVYFFEAAVKRKNCYNERFRMSH